jgi:ABC-type nitrate/sulfonate/bicarbonate transport system substrate-binding protein
MARCILDVLGRGGGRLGLVLAALVSTWCLPALAGENVVLQLSGDPKFEFAGYYAAIEQGYYGEAGLNVTLSQLAADGILEDAILTGKSQFGIGTSELILVRSTGKPVVALAPIFQHSPYIFLVTKASGISSIHDLKGKRIMHEKSASDLIAYLEYEGVAFKDVTLLPVTGDTTALLDGTVDAMSAWTTDEPFWFRQQGVECLSFTPRAGGIDFYGDTLFTSEQYLKDKPEVVQAFLDATRRGWQYALAQPEATADLIIAKYHSSHSREHLLFEAAETQRLIMPDVVEIGYSNPGRWQSIAETYKNLGMLNSDFKFTRFLYQPDVPVVPTWFYQVLLIALVLIVAISLVAARFYRLHQTVNLQALSLQKAIAETRVLRGLIPVCAHCKKIRDDEGFWQNVETYIRAHSEAAFTHGICPACLDEYYPEIAEQVKQDMLEEAAAAKN